MGHKQAVYTFDVKTFLTVYVRAESEEEARDKILGENLLALDHEPHCEADGVEMVDVDQD